MQPDSSPSVPPFPTGDLKNPKDGDYTGIFNRLKKERQMDQTSSPYDGTPRTPPSQWPMQRQNSDHGYKVREQLKLLHLFRSNDLDTITVPKILTFNI